MQTLSHLPPVICGLSIAVCCMGVDRVSAKVADRKPNIVLIVSDAAGYDDFSFQGSGDVKTPHIDKNIHYDLGLSHSFVDENLVPVKK